MVFFQATARPTGPAARLFTDFVEGGRLTLYVSDAILDEVRDVLGRPQIRAKNPALTDEAVSEFCNRVRQVAQRIDPIPATFALARDPDDEPYVNLAIAATADYLVTRDKDMLGLMQDAAFRAQYPTLTILDPVALLQILNPPPPQP
jgi:putative PIN family toxin of toxin-antitoxin system